MTEIPAPSEADLRLARIVRLRPQPFRDIFMRARPDAGYDMAESFKDHDDDDTKIAKAFAYARANNWVDRLIVAYLYRNEPVMEGTQLLAEAALQGLVSPNSELQSIQDVAAGFINAGVEFEAMSRIIHQVCRIDIGTEKAGTGFIIRSDLVITAWHVIKSLTEIVLDQNGQPTGLVRSLPDTAGKISLVFDDYALFRNNHLARLSGRTVHVADEWLAFASPAHAFEMLGLAVNNPAELQNCMDVAIIRLKSPMFLACPPSEINTRDQLRQGDPLTIYQHPAGRDLRVARAKVSQVGQWRFEHEVNTLNGSSGSPCFDRQFNVVGLHHAGPDPGIIMRSSANRAVPLANLEPVIRDVPLPPPGLSPLVELTAGRPGHPVFGRMETVRWVQRMLADGDNINRKPILALHGESGDGCTFTHDLLSTLLPAGGNLLVQLKATELQKDTPREAAMRILDAMGDQKTSLPEHLQDAHYDGPDGYIARDLLPALIEAIKHVRKSTPANQSAANQVSVGEHSKRVFIVVDGINHASIGTGTPISNFLFALYAQVKTEPWLFFVLLGYKNALANDDLRPFVELHELSPPIEDDVLTWALSKTPPVLQANSLAWTRALTKQFCETARADGREQWYRKIADQAAKWTIILRNMQEGAAGQPPPVAVSMGSTDENSHG